MVEMFLAFIAGMTAIGCLTGIIITFIRRRSKQPLPPVEVTRRLDDVLERLARLENGIDCDGGRGRADLRGPAIHGARARRAFGRARRCPDRPRGYTTPH